MMRSDTQCCSQASPRSHAKQLLVDYVKPQLLEVERLAGHADFFDFGDESFRPGIRTSVAMNHLPSKAALLKFLSAWKKTRQGSLPNLG